MFHKFWAAAMVAIAVFAGSVAPISAQSDDEVVWIQIEAQPNLRVATQSAREYAAELEDVNGFSLGGGWYGVALGPYRRADAERVLRAYRRDRLVPNDSYIALTSSFRQQFYPVGANVLNREVLQAPQEVAQEEAEAETGAEAVQEAAAEPIIEVADETQAQAQRSERALSRDEKKQLQVMLKWAGFYNAGIDGSFGRGTRNSMAAWQEANNFERTGVLTTLQRAALLKQYNAVLDGLGLQVVTDAAAGIEMQMPTAAVTFDKHEYPFAHYKTANAIGAKLLLISQKGNQDTLFGLYDIMQTLEVVPLDGPRERGSDAFVLVGQNATIISETRVSLRNGMIKGFTLIWPANDEERRTRLLAIMQDSFTRLDGVLDPGAGVRDDQAIDLVAGLAIRTPKISRSGFYVDARGTVVTTTQAVQNCTRITLDQEHEATLVHSDAASGVAILTPKTGLAPLDTAALSSQTPRLGSEIAMAGYSYEGVLDSPAMTFGTFEDLKGLQGEDTLNRLSLAALDGDAGGPVIDSTGGVIGMLLPRTDNGQLPADVRFSANRASVQEALAAAGKSVRQSSASAALDPLDIATAARGMTVLVSCWE